jgi:hypothetical protein
MLDVVIRLFGDIDYTDPWMHLKYSNCWPKRWLALHVFYHLPASSTIQRREINFQYPSNTAVLAPFTVTFS